MTNRLIFVPGKGCQAFEHYPKTCANLEDAGFEISPVSPVWDARFDTLQRQIDHDVARRIGAGVIVIAHSQGANLAMPPLARYDNDDIGIIIASPSTACAEGLKGEDRKRIEQNFSGQLDRVRQIGMHALASVARVSPEKVAVLSGEEEIKTYPFMDAIAHATADGFGVDVTQVQNAPHFIDHHEGYINAVVDAALRIRLNI